MDRNIGILTAGGDSPGLNAAIRGIGKAAHRSYGMNVIGFRDGFRGLMQNRTIRLDGSTLSGILTAGGTILGTSRDKPHKMPVGGRTMDMTDLMVDNYHSNHLDALVCLGGGGTQKNALHLAKAGLRVLTLPKTIDNDVARTDVTFGYDTALTIATETIDRLHSTAHSHHRIVVVEVMGHNAGWLALGSGLAGGADVILIPEIRYDLERVAQAVIERRQAGSTFSIIAVSEGALSREQAENLEKWKARKKNAANEHELRKATLKLEQARQEQAEHTHRLARKLEDLTRLESRVTILGHVQRGGVPSPGDRVLATRLGSACARYIDEGIHGVMVAARGEDTEPVPLEEVAGRRKTVPLDHPWIESARSVGVGFGD